MAPNTKPEFKYTLDTDTSHSSTTVEVAKPIILEDQDVILKVTGTTVCGSDLHLLHGSIIQLNKGDILGHEFCGIVDQVGPGVKNIKVGKRYVAAFQITCGEVRISPNQNSLSLTWPAANSWLVDSAFIASRNFPRSVKEQTPTQPPRPCMAPKQPGSLGTRISRVDLLAGRPSMCGYRSRMPTF